MARNSKQNVCQVCPQLSAMDGVVAAAERMFTGEHAERIATCRRPPAAPCRRGCYATGFLGGSLLAVPKTEKSPGSTGRNSFMQRSKNGDLFVRLLPRRAAVAPQLIADPRIRVGAEYLASHVIPDTRDTRAGPVHLSRGSVVRLRAGLRDRRCCHESGKGDGG
jgi:hypothetical protein